MNAISRRVIACRRKTLKTKATARDLLRDPLPTEPRRVIVPDSLTEICRIHGVRIDTGYDPMWTFSTYGGNVPMLQWFTSTGHWIDWRGRTGVTKDYWFVAYRVSSLAVSAGKVKAKERYRWN
jgi:hypothetical protein